MSSQQTITAGKKDEQPKAGKKSAKRKPFLLEARWLDGDLKRFFSWRKGWWLHGRYATAKARDEALKRHQSGRSMWSHAVKKIEFRARDE